MMKLVMPRFSALAAAFNASRKGGFGLLSAAQKRCIAELEEAGAIVGVVYGIDEALAWLEKHELLRGKAR